MKTINRRWHCTACGLDNGIHGGIVKQLSKTTAIAGRCRWCGPRPKVKLLEVKP